MMNFIHVILQIDVAPSGSDVQPTKSRNHAVPTTITAQTKPIVQSSSQLQSVQQSRPQRQGILKQSSGESGEERSNGSGARRKGLHEHRKRY